LGNKVGLINKVKDRFITRSILIQECIVLIACFLYLFFQVRPNLALELQQPPFLMDAIFFNEFLKIPGGLADWISALMMQFWYSDYIASSFLALCLWMVAYLTRKWMEILTENRQVNTIHLIPVCLLLVLISQYNFRLSVIISLVINLSFLNLLIRWEPKRQASRVILGLIVSILMFWITGGAFLMFGVLYGLTDLLSRKKLINGLSLLLVSLILPYSASASVFLITVEQAYLHNLILENSDEFWYIRFAFIAFYLLVLVTVFLSKFIKVREYYDKIARFIRLKKIVNVGALAIGTILLFCGSILLLWKTHDIGIRYVIEVNQCIREGRWQDALKTTTQCPIVNPLLQSQTNMALFQSGMLLDRMFTYPQFYGAEGLLMDFEWSSAWPVQTSNSYWELGLVNESLHWAHEAFETKGPTSETLKRLSMVYMIKGENKAARRFLLNLRQIPFQEKTADYLIHLNENQSEFAKDGEIMRIRSCMPVDNLALYGKSIPKKLELLLRRNPKNKMAFEYLIAYYLINGNLRGVVNNIQAFGALGYTQIPRHIQEALLVFGSLNRNLDPNQIGSLVEPLVYKHFIEYQRILSKYDLNINGAKQELQAQFGNTYWFYLMYIGRPSLQPEIQHEYQ
jgi:hypothetical protein